MTHRSPPAALLAVLLFGLLYLAVLIPADLLSLWRYGFVAALPIRLLCYAVVVVSVLVAWRLSGSKFWALRRRNTPRSEWGFTSWCGGSMSWAFPGFEVGLHYPPRWARYLPIVRDGFAAGLIIGFALVAAVIGGVL
ncbi:MAG: hypothetical protein K2Q20_15070 [Phycisphaerales bacterium]|nr:hypothetical protein [Phycisphaerales bacterium]